MLRLDQTPSINVRIIQSAEAPGAIGEARTVGAAPALANAIFAATGKRPRSLLVDRRLLAKKRAP